MNMFKKVGIGVSGILVTTIGTMVLLNNSTIKATDEVTMQAFNELKAEVETLRETINTTKEELTICKTSNENLKVEVNNLKTQTTNNASEISKTKNDLTEVANRTSKIEAWQSKFHEIFTKSPFPMSMGYDRWTELDNFKKNQ